MTFKERHILQEQGPDMSALKELSDYHSSTKNLFNKTAPFMDHKDRETVSSNQHQLGQSIDKKWSDHFKEPQNNNAVPTQGPNNDLLGDVASPDSVNGPVAGLSDIFG